MVASDLWVVVVQWWWPVLWFFFSSILWCFSGSGVDGFGGLLVVMGCWWW